MVLYAKSSPFFFSVQTDLAEINNQPDKAKDKLIAREPVFYQKTMFRAFLGYSGTEIEEMTLGEYMDNVIMLREVLKLWHAPFQKED